MRQYRGLTKEGKWVYGWYIAYNFGGTIDKPKMQYYVVENWQDHCQLSERLTEVIPETVGQQTGLKDKNGIEIYEGDIVKHIPEPNNYGGWWDGVVTWQPEGSMGWCIEPLPENKHRGRYGMNYNYVFEIIGNIHQNPKLLEKQ